MSLVIAFAICIAIASAAATVYGARIARELRLRGLKASPRLLRGMLLKYLADYKRVTVAESGHPGPLYQPCLRALLLALASALCLIVTLVATGRA